jgi:hypothetical protein
MTVICGLAVDGTKQIELIDYFCGPEIESLYKFDSLCLISCAEAVDI